jgi:hypothetical protein
VKLLVHLVLLAAAALAGCSYFEFRHQVDLIICHHSNEWHCAPPAPAPPDLDRGM